MCSKHTRLNHLFYADGHFLLAHSTSDGRSARLVLQKLRRGFQQLVDANEAASSVWRKDPRLETGNLNGLQFTEGPDLKFHGMVAAPGRRYLVFSERALEVDRRPSVWSTQKSEVSE